MVSGCYGAQYRGLCANCQYPVTCLWLQNDGDQSVYSVRRQLHKMQMILRNLHGSKRGSIYS